METVAVERILRKAGAQGRIFSVGFIKRATGERRVLTGRLGVWKHLRGGQLAFDPRAKGLLVVFDMHKQSYRMVNLETVTHLNGKEIKEE